MKLKPSSAQLKRKITPDLSGLQMDGVTSKGSRFRKSVFEYVSTYKSNQNNKLIVEINSFANPFPFQRLAIKSFVFDFLDQTKNEKFIEKYDLQFFEVNVLAKEQTLLEKTVSLIRFSFDENTVESISKKIRHFYDLHFLLNNPECAEFVASDSFKNQFYTILHHDREMFEEPRGWQTKQVAESPLLNDFSTVWEQIKAKYQTELSNLAYRAIPEGESVARSFVQLSNRIK